MKTEWEFSNIYKSMEDFNKDYELVKENIGKIKTFRGKLTNPKELFDFMEFVHQTGIDPILERLLFYVYQRQMLNNVDTEANNLEAKLNQLKEVFNKELSFVDDEIFKLSMEERKRLVNDPILKDYRYALDDYVDEKYVHHSEETNKELSKVYSSFGAHYDAFSVLLDTDMKYSKMKCPDGKTRKIDDAGYDFIINSKFKHKFKLEAAEKYYKTPKCFNNTFAKILNAQIKENLACAKVEGFDKYLDYVLYNEEIDREIYDNIKNLAHNLIPIFHKYIKTLKDISGHKHFYYFDTISGVSKYKGYQTFTDHWEDVKKVLSRLGSEYEKGMNEIVDSGCVDVYPKQSKISGACENSCHRKDILPFILLNFPDLICSSETTFVHEMGHAMYEYLSSHNDNIKQVYKDPGIFTHEIASITNEFIYLFNKMEHTSNKEEICAYLERILDLINGTIIRQVMYSEFEEYLYSVVENGGALDAKDLNNKWMELNKQYYGPDCEFPKYFEYRWSGIPHFYYGYYVFKYATSCAYALAIANNIHTTKQADNYINFLKLGGSKKPAQLVKETGIDPLDIKTYDFVKDEYEKLIERFKTLYEGKKNGKK